MLTFFKYHGLGNDFVLVDTLRSGGEVSAELAQALCDRHTGIGADGLLVVLPSIEAECRMRLFNADGSEAEMCGNGIRCVVKYLVDNSFAMGPEVKIQTGRGVLTCFAHRGEGRQVDSVTVNMGPAVFDRARIPMQGEGEFVGEEISAGGRRFKGTAVSMGNPHLVIFDTASLSLAESVGPLLESHDWFPQRANVGFAEAHGRTELSVVVYERGVGVTRACGTGACAATAAAVKLGLVDPDREVKVNLPGGSLFVRVAPAFESVWMRGPATLVFRGETA